MKLKKDQFKKILKECIMELVEEGAFDKVISESLHSSSHGRAAANDLISGNARQQQANDRLKQLAHMTAMATSGNDPERAKMMAKIFEDTAKTTLQRTLAMEKNMPGMNEIFVGEPVTSDTLKAEQASLESLTGGRGVKHWAALAFGKYNK